MCLTLVDVFDHSANFVAQQSLLLQFHPTSYRLRLRAEPRIGHLPEVLRDVVIIQYLDASRKILSCLLPDPGGSIRNHPNSMASIQPGTEGQSSHALTERC